MENNTEHKGGRKVNKMNEIKKLYEFKKEMNLLVIRMRNLFSLCNTNAYFYFVFYSVQKFQFNNIFNLFYFVRMVTKYILFIISIFIYVLPEIIYGK